MEKYQSKISSVCLEILLKKMDPFKIIFHPQSWITGLCSRWISAAICSSTFSIIHFSPIEILFISIYFCKVFFPVRSAIMPFPDYFFEIKCLVLYLFIINYWCLFDLLLCKRPCHISISYLLGLFKISFFFNNLLWTALFLFFSHFPEWPHSRTFALLSCLSSCLYSINALVKNACYSSLRPNFTPFL